MHPKLSQEDFNLVKNSIIKRCKAEADDKKSVTVGWVLRQVLGYLPTDGYVYRQIRAELELDNRYITEKLNSSPTDFNIRRNPNYKNQLVHDFKVALIAAALSICTGIILWQYQRQDTNQEIQQLQKQLDTVKYRVDHLPKK